MIRNTVHIRYLSSLGHPNLMRLQLRWLPLTLAEVPHRLKDAAPHPPLKHLLRLHGDKAKMSGPSPPQMPEEPPTMAMLRAIGNLDMPR